MNPMGACGTGATNGSCRDEVDVLALGAVYHSSKGGFDVLGDRGLSSSSKEDFDTLLVGVTKSTDTGFLRDCFRGSDEVSVVL